MTEEFQEQYQLVLSTCPNDEVAKEIAYALIEHKVAACVNILPNITSVYRWENKISCDREVQLLIKTTADKFTELSVMINNLHPYTTSEIIALNIQQGDKNYLNWITESLK
jgi:periplasmic divalent cation tolerance protein